jgi:hypothetical protein
VGNGKELKSTCYRHQSLRDCSHLIFAPRTIQPRTTLEGERVAVLSSRRSTSMPAEFQYDVFLSHNSEGQAARAPAGGTAEAGGAAGVVR